MTASAGKKVTVRQVKSGIGFNRKQKRTLRALGLGKIGRVRELTDNDQVRGMIQRVIHLVEVVQDS
jgi:large subunit ribosomal protein L30